MLASDKVNVISNAQYISKSIFGLSTFVIRQDGTVWSTGYNVNGQLGIGTQIDEWVVKKVGQFTLQIKGRPFRVKEGEEKQLEVGLIDSFNVLNKDGVALDFTYESSDTNVFTVDENGIVTGKKVGNAIIKVLDKATGLNTTAEVSVLQDAEGAIAKPMIASGEDFSAVLKQDGTVWTAGNNANGQLGDGTTLNRKEFAQVKLSEDEYLTDIVEIAVRHQLCSSA